MAVQRRFFIKQSWIFLQMNMGRCLRDAFFLGGLALLPWLAGPAWAEAVPTTGSSSVFIPYDNTPADQAGLAASPRLRARFDRGRPIRFTMDTGSTGIVVSADHFRPNPGERPVGQGVLTYTSSGIVLDGHYYQADITIGEDTASATASVPVLLVRRIRCTAHARHCHPKRHATGIAMFGIGFGQEKAGQPHGTPDKNPFLHIIRVGNGGALPSAGYLLMSRGVTLGLTPGNIQGFQRLQLTRNAEGNDWSRIPVQVSVAGATGVGTLLPDTGIQYMYLAPPHGSAVPTIPGSDAVGPCRRFGPCAAPDTRIAIDIGRAGDPPVASYAFTVGADGVAAGDTPAAPEWVTVLKPRAEVFINTSYHFLNAFDYFYDPVNGVVGFAARAR